MAHLRVYRELEILVFHMMLLSIMVHSTLMMAAVQLQSLMGIFMPFSATCIYSGASKLSDFQPG